MKVGTYMNQIKEIGSGEGKHTLDLKRILKIWISLLPPLLIFLICPLGMTPLQSSVAAVLLLTIIWWCTGWVDKTVASCILIVFFLLFSGAPAKTVLAFPRSSTFLLIALTYLFSRGIHNARLAEKYLEPMLRRFGRTPLKVLLLAVLMLVVTTYIIPQPLARLIIVADILKAYLDRTDADPEEKSALIFGVYFIYVFVNMLTMNADIILNTTAVAVAGLSMKDADWMRCMAVPSVIYLVAALALLCLIFRKELIGGKTIAYRGGDAGGTESSGEKRSYRVEILAAATVILWLTEPLHGIPNWAVTLASVLVMYAFGVLKLKDLSAIDVKMLVFLTAAMSIGGVMSANGTSDCVFSVLKGLIHGDSLLGTILPVMLITICMHMILGSNTTTVSVVIPGIIYICADVLSAESVMFIVYITSVTQWLFPFHSVGLMMGVSRNAFTAKHVLKVGIPLTIMVFAAIFALYIPWWRLIGVFPG